MTQNSQGDASEAEIAATSTRPDQGLLHAPWVHGGLIALVALALYLPALAGEFVYDDVVLVESNPWLNSWDHLSRAFQTHLFGFTEGAEGGAYYRPLMQVLLIAVGQVVGTQPWAFHLVSLVLHTAASCFVWGLARRLWGAGPVGASGALVAGLLFAVHPVHVEAVAWVSGMMDLATTAFGLLTLLLLTRNEVSPRTAILGALSWLAAMLFKEMAVVVPLLLLVWDVAMPGRELRRRHWRRRYLPLAAVAVVYACMRVMALGTKTTSGAHASMGWQEGLLSIPVLVAEYTKLLFFPATLNVYREFSAPGNQIGLIVLGMMVLVGFLVLCFQAWQSDRRWLVPILWMGIPLIPVLYVPALGDSVVAERYAYLPSVGASLLIGGAWVWMRNRAPSRQAIAGLGAGVSVLLVVLALRTNAYLPAWQDERSLWTASLEAQPGVAIPLYNLGNAYLQLGELDAAIELLEASVVRRPSYAPAVSNLAVAYGKAGRFERTIELLEPAVRAVPSNARYQHNLALAYAKVGRTSDAVETFQIAMKLGPGTADPAYEIARIQFEEGNLNEARRALDEALRRDPEHAPSRRLKQKLLRSEHQGR